MLIADSGSTKTTWVWIANGESKRLVTSGINVHFQSVQQQKEILSETKAWLNEDTEQLIFYGTGLTSIDTMEAFRELLNDVFDTPKVLEIYTDTVGAARALFGQNSGLSCILGTGASVGLYDGSKLDVRVPALGFWLGDEGSGAYLGKELIKAYLRGLLEKEIEVVFDQQYGPLERTAIFEIIKTDSRPNAYFASYTPFVRQHLKDSKVLQAIVQKGFEDFVSIYILPYQLTTEDSIGFIGSVGYYFHEELKEVLKNKKVLSSVVFVKDPMDGLIAYNM